MKHEHVLAFSFERQLDLSYTMRLFAISMRDSWNNTSVCGQIYFVLKDYCNFMINQNYSQVLYLGKLFIRGKWPDYFFVGVFMGLLMIVQMPKPSELMRMLYQSLVSRIFFVVTLSKATPRETKIEFESRNLLREPLLYWYQFLKKENMLDHRFNPLEWLASNVSLQY